MRLHDEGIDMFH